MGPLPTRIRLLAALALLGPCAGQRPPSPPPAEPPDPTLAYFRSFDKETRAALARQLGKQIKLDPNPEIQRIVSMQRDFRKLPVAGPTPYHRAADWARGVAPQRELVVRGDERHDAMRKRFPPRVLLPDLHKAAWYDWGTGRVVRRTRELDDRELIENLYHGYPPGSDLALAQLLAKFDSDPKMRKLGSYLAHLYAGLDAAAYEDITLYEAWYSGQIIDVPDVDAIPFERKVLGTRRFKSPIPGDARRTQLYQTIRDHAFAYRKYRTLREAAAAAFLHAEPRMDPTYAPLVPRFHYLYVAHADDPSAIARVLASGTTRDALIQKIDQVIAANAGELAKRDARRKNLEAMRTLLRSWVRLAVQAQRERQRDRR